MVRTHVIRAVFKRNVLSFFSSILGYLFIIAFVLAGAFAAFDDQFFANNEASLDQLTEWFPVLLIFVVPAITMSMWSDEKKLGTDELLFTLPGADWEILLGKYLAGLFTYTVVVGFSVSHAIVLAWIGEPDWGVVLSTFIGYWVAGAAMIAIGMFASVLTNSATVAFVLGALFCSVPVFIDQAPGVEWLKLQLGFREPLSIGGNLAFFTLGMVPVNGVIYFALLTVFFLYLNAVAVARRHWGGSPWGISYGWQYAVRVISLGVIVVSLSYVGSKAAGMRLDLTAEKLFTLTDMTQRTIARIDEKNPITVDAYITPEVPEQYLQVQKNLYGILRQLDRTGGGKLTVRIVDTDPASREADEARNWGIEPVTRNVEERGRLVTSTIFMGAVIRSNTDQIVIPFFDQGTPVEYKLTRSISTALKDKRLVVGILETPAELIGPVSFTPQGTPGEKRPEWRIVQELREQYIVKSVNPAQPIEEAFDVLLAAMPSALPNDQIQNLVNYVKSGRPVLVVDDPYPLSLPDLSLYPGFVNPQMGISNIEQKPAYAELLKTLGITWNSADVVFDQFNPHPIFQDRLPPEYLFLTAEQPNNERPCLNPESPISKPFREVLVLHSGHINRRSGTSLDLLPLVRTRKKTTGVLNVNDMFGWSGGAPGLGRPAPIDSTLPHTPDKLNDYIVAARISSRDPSGVNAIVIADLEFMGDPLFNLWERQNFAASLDNVLLLLNCVDTLAGNEDFLELRGRYRRRRELDEVERRRETFQRNLTQKITDFQKQADEKEKSARARIDEAIRRIDEDPRLDAGEKRRRKAVTREVMERQVNNEIQRVALETEAAVRQERFVANEEIKAVENLVRIQALVIPPLLPIAVGLMVLGWRILGEQRGIIKERMVKATRTRQPGA